MKWRFHYRYIPVVLTLCLGVGLSSLASISMGKWEQENNQVQFQQRSNHLTLTLQKGIDRYVEILYTIGNLYSSSPEVEQQTFQAFAQRMMTTHPGIQAIGWVEPASSEKLQQLNTISVLQVGNSASNEATISPERLKKSFSIIHLESHSPTQFTKDFELSANSAYRTAIERAENTREITFTKWISRKLHHGEDFDVLILIPVHHHASLSVDTPTQDKDLKGFVLGILRVSDVIEETLQDIEYGIDFYLYDEKNFNQRPLGFYEANSSQVKSANGEQSYPKPNTNDFCPTSLDCSRHLTLGQQQPWSLLFLPTERYQSIDPKWGAEAMLAIGLLLTGSPFVYLSMLMASLDRDREISELKLRLFSTASHEFRTPLSTILISAQVLEESHSNCSQEKKIKNLHRIQASAKKMNQLLTDILTISRAEAGKLEFQPESLDIKKFCKEVIEEIQFSTEAKQQILFEIHSPCSNTHLDSKLLSPIMNNLLLNAIKYSPPQSTIYVNVTCTLKEIILQVRDQGIGISLEDQKRLYEAFYRGKAVTDIEGTGLGLSVVKTCVDLHGGQISVESEVGTGTAFTVILPVQ